MSAEPKRQFSFDAALAEVEPLRERLGPTGQLVFDVGLSSTRRFFEITGAQQATVLAAQAFTSLIPFLVVFAAIGPGSGDLGDRLVNRLNLDGASADATQALFASSGDVESAVTWVSAIILVLSALSFTRALQRILQRAYRIESAVIAGIPRGFVWLLGVGAWFALTASLRSSLETSLGPLFAMLAALVSGFLLWSWTPALLLKGVTFRDVRAGAVVMAVLGAAASVVSSIYMPIVTSWSAERYGLIGVAFSLQSWLFIFGFVIVIGAVVGAVINEEVTSRREIRA